MEKNMKNVYICITESLCCTAETNTTLLNQPYFSKKKIKQHLDIMENTEELEHIYIRLQDSHFLVTLWKILEVLLLFLLYGLISSKYMKY